MSDPPRLRWTRLRWKGSALVLTVGSVILLTAAIAVPRYAHASAQIFVIVLGALVIRLLVQAVRVATSTPGPIPFDEALLQPPEREIRRAREPDRIAFEVGASTHRALELHHQFRRRLRRLAADRLTSEHGVDLDTDQDAARALLGAEAWDLLRPDHEAPEDRFGPGMPIEDVTKIVTAVEDLSR
jgi:hypothetical protein